MKKILISESSAKKIADTIQKNKDVFNLITCEASDLSYIMDESEEVTKLIPLIEGEIIDEGLVTIKKINNNKFNIIVNESLKGYEIEDKIKESLKLNKKRKLL